ncbi:AmmeMemoRadiSam system radical SAM enzyme [bacterium]|nr:AmmeMemoRadiSam system radical SAM enzyme [bacterium]
MAAEVSLRETLRLHVREGELYRSVDEKTLECFACGHRCLIKEGRQGICKIRFNQGGRLLVPHGYTAGIQVDPIEKKPFFHVLPGAKALSFGMLGCDLHCAYCQNWITSQALTDPNAGIDPMIITPQQLTRIAKSYQARIMTSTYNEPLITSEWAVDIFKEAKKENMICSYVSNGNATPEVLAYLRPYVDLYKVDLKSFNDKNYRKLGTKLDTVLDSMHLIYESGFWLEVVTLVIPTFNDSNDELRAIAEFVVSLSPDIPWHVTAFHPDYKMTDPDNTSAESLFRSAQIGKEAGLRYVYAGNLPGSLGTLENTYCHHCQVLLIERVGFRVLQNKIKKGACFHCRTPIPGIWH